MIPYTGAVTDISEDTAKNMPLSTAPVTKKKCSWESTKRGAPEGLEAFPAGSAQPHGSAKEKRLHSSVLKGSTARVLPGKACEAIHYGFLLRNKEKKKESIYFSYMLIAVLIWTINVSFWQETLVAPYLTHTFIATALQNKTYSLLFRLSCCTQLLGSQVSHLYCTTPGITYADASAVGVLLLPGLFLRGIKTVSAALPLSQRQAFLVR